MRRIVACWVMWLASVLHGQELLPCEIVLRRASLNGSPYYPLALSQDGKSVVLNGFRQGRLRLVETETGKHLAAMEFTVDQIKQFQFLAGDQTLLASDHQRLYLWNMKLRQMQAICPDAKAHPELEHLSTYTASGDGSTLVTFYLMRYGAKDPVTFQVWDPVTGKKLGEAIYSYPKINNTATFHLALSHDGKQLAIFQHDRYGKYGDTIHFWSLITQSDGSKTFKELPKLTVADRSIEQVVFYPEGTEVAVVLREVKAGDKQEQARRYSLHVYSLATRQGRLCIESNMKGGFGPLVYHPDGTYLAECDIDHATVWDTKTWQPCLQLQRDLKNPRWPDLRSLHFVGSQRVQFAILQEGEAGRWLVDLQPPGQLHQPALPDIKKQPWLQSRVTGLQLSQDQKSLYTVDSHGWIAVWDMKNQQVVKCYHPGLPYKKEEYEKASQNRNQIMVLSTLLSPQGKYLASQARLEDKQELVLTNLSRGEHRRFPSIMTDKADPKTYQNISFSPDNNYFLVESYVYQMKEVQRIQEHSLQLLETSTGKLVWMHESLPYGKGYFRFDLYGQTISNPVQTLSIAAGKPETIIQSTPYPVLTDAVAESIKVLPQGSFVHQCTLLPDERSAIVKVGHNDKGRGYREIYWVERMTREPRLKFATDRENEVHRYQHSIDGKRLFMVNDTNDILIYHLHRTKAPTQQLSPEDLKRHWQTLGEGPAAPAWQAMLALMNDPTRSIPFLTQEFKPNPDWERLPQLIAELDHEEFARREAASEALKRIGLIAEPALQQAASSSSPEKSRRARQLLAKLADGDAGFLRMLRVIELLERLGTPETFTLLKSFASVKTANPLMEEAQASLRRLQK